MTIKREYQKKIKLAIHTRRTKWAPFWAVIRAKGKGKRTHPSQLTKHRRHWRRTKGKSTTIIDCFTAAQIHKDKTMHEGTWGVYGTVQHLSVQLELVIVKQQGVVRAVPPFKHTGKKLIALCPGHITKDEMLPKLEIELNRPLSKEEVLSALPAGGFRVYRL